MKQRTLDDMYELARQVWLQAVQARENRATTTEKNDKPLDPVQRWREHLAQWNRQFALYASYCALNNAFVTEGKWTGQLHSYNVNEWESTLQVKQRRMPS